MCIGIVEICFVIAIGYISSILTELSPHDTIMAGYYRLTFLFLKANLVNLPIVYVQRKDNGGQALNRLRMHVFTWEFDGRVWYMVYFVQYCQCQGSSLWNNFIPILYNWCNLPTEWI